MCSSDLLQNGRRVAVIGEFARTPRYQGGGSAHVRPAQLEVPLDCLRKAYPDLIFAPGYRLDGGDAALADAAVQAAEQAEVALVFAGLPDAYEAECYDRVDLELLAEQNELIARICHANPNTVVVLFAGSAVTMPWAQQAKSILMAYLPGQAVGSALTDVLTGACEPTGRLAETFPARLEDTPSYGNFPGDGSVCDYAEGIYVGYRWYDKRKIDPQFAFGQGESYTQFAYRDISLSAGELDADGAVQVNVTVQNIDRKSVGRERVC